jgi:hypothetical protein
MLAKTEKAYENMSTEHKKIGGEEGTDTFRHRADILRREEIWLDDRRDSERQKEQDSKNKTDQLLRDIEPLLKKTTLTESEAEQLEEIKNEIEILPNLDYKRAQDQIKVAVDLSEMELMGAPTEQAGLSFKNQSVNEGQKQIPKGKWVLAAALLAVLGLSTYLLKGGGDPSRERAGRKTGFQTPVKKRKRKKTKRKTRKLTTRKKIK